MEKLKRNWDAKAEVLPAASLSKEAPSLNLRRLIMLLPLAALLSAASLLVSAHPSHSKRGSFELTQHLGNLSPYFTPSATPRTLRSGTPDGCTVDKVFHIGRHGSRHPIPEEFPTLANLSYYINNSTALFGHPRTALPSQFAFLASKGWVNKLVTNDLSPLGREQLFSHGVAMRLDYPQLDTKRLLAGGQDRVVESAQWFAAGYGGRNYNATLTLDVIGENKGTVSWITSTYACKAWSYGSGGKLVDQWGETYLPPIAERFNKKLARAYPGVAFTPAHVHGMLYACAYEDAVYGAGSSDWCGVFEQRDIEAFEYELDLLMRGAFGYGLPNDQGSVLGSLFVSNFTSFLAGPENLSLNFAHDTTIDLILTTLGLASDPSFPVSGPPRSTRAWRTSYQVPFGAQMIWRRLSCGSSAPKLQLQLNGANFDLAPTGCKSDKYGACVLDDFLQTDKVKRAEAVRQGDERWIAACGA